MKEYNRNGILFFGEQSYEVNGVVLAVIVGDRSCVVWERVDSLLGRSPSDQVLVPPVCI